MIHDEFPGVALHNVTETEAADWADGGHRLRRVPASVTDDVNVAARDRYRHPAGCELRFVPDDDEAAVSVTLSAASETVVRPFWGEFQATEAREIGPTPRTLTFSVPEHVGAVDPDVAAMSPFDPRVCRLRFDAWTSVAVHAVEGRCRPPRADDRPDRRYLAYGTSITEGASASACHLTYVARAARRLGADALNLGVSGSAFCDPAVAEYVAERDDWDIATLALSVNMAHKGFTVEQFRSRVNAFVETVATARPDARIACVTLFPYRDDVCRDGDRQRAAAFRTAVRRAAASAPDNVSLIDGPDLVDVTGMTADVLHPGDAGMISIGERLAARLKPLFDGGAIDVGGDP